MEAASEEDCFASVHRAQSSINTAAKVKIKKKKVEDITKGILILKLGISRMSGEISNLNTYFS